MINIVWKCRYPGDNNEQNYSETYILNIWKKNYVFYDNNVLLKCYF